jgi:hypothetical protein
MCKEEAVTHQHWSRQVVCPSFLRSAHAACRHTTCRVFVGLMALLPDDLAALQALGPCAFDSRLKPPNGATNNVLASNAPATLSWVARSPEPVLATT